MFKSFANVNKPKFYISCIFCLLPILYYGILYKNLPYLIPIQYDLAGNPYNFIDKASYTFLLPIVALVLNIIFIWTTSLSNKYETVKSNILYTIPYYLIPFLINFFAIINLVVFFDIKFNVQTLIAVVFGGLIVIMGFASRKIPLNPRIGLRTPWSRASEELWRKSNTTAGYLYMIAGFVYIILGIMGYSLIVLVVSLIVATLIAIIMSYVYYKLDLKKQQTTTNL